MKRILNDENHDHTITCPPREMSLIRAEASTPRRFSQVKSSRKENRPETIGHLGKKFCVELAAPDGADQRIQNVIHRHAPSGDVAQRGMNFPAHVGESRTGAGINTRHVAVADRGEKHGDHGDQDCGHHVAARLVVDDAVDAHRRDRLNDNDADDDEVPEASECV